MRVIAGIAKGHALQAPKGTKTRPTADRVKEAVFSVLGDLVFKAKVLDCYGALLAVFFEREREALNTIKKNLLKTNFSENTKVYGGDVVKILPGLTKAEFDLVFLDPPYNRGEIAKIENALLQEGILKQDAVVVLETEKKQPELFQTENWELKKTSFYGDTAVYYYKKFNAKEKGVKI